MGEFVDWITNRIEKPVGATKRELETDLIHCLQALKVRSRGHCWSFELCMYFVDCKVVILYLKSSVI